MGHKICLVLITILLIGLAYVSWQGINNNKSNDELKNSLDHQLSTNNDLERDLTNQINARYTAAYTQGLILPSGLDEHYVRIRSFEELKFSSKGDEGWLVFHIMLVLHDLGNVSFDQCKTEFINDTGVPCKQLTTDFAQKMINYIDETDGLLRVSNVNEVKTVYDWINQFVGYVNDTGGYPRFPVETLSYRYGDCEDQAMALSFLLESRGYNTALCLVHDKNLTQYGADDGLYHTFCAVLNNNNLDYNGTLIELKEYPEYGRNWIVLDPAYNQVFGQDPQWLSNYQNVSSGFVTIPSSVYHSLRVDYYDAANRALILGIPL